MVPALFNAGLTPERRSWGNFSGKMEISSRKGREEPILNMSDL
jgi:hypothetical protein